MSGTLADFDSFRARMNEAILGGGESDDQPLLLARPDDL